MVNITHIYYQFGLKSFIIDQKYDVNLNLVFLEFIEVLHIPTSEFLEKVNSKCLDCIIHVINKLLCLINLYRFNLLLIPGLLRGLPSLLRDFQKF